MFKKPGSVLGSRLSSVTRKGILTLACLCALCYLGGAVLNRNGYAVERVQRNIVRGGSTSQHSKVQKLCLSLQSNVVVFTCSTSKCLKKIKNPHYEAHYINTIASAANKLREYGCNIKVITESMQLLEKYSSLCRSDVLIFPTPAFNRVRRITSSGKCNNISYVLVDWHDAATLLPFKWRKDIHMLEGTRDETLYHSEQTKAILMHTVLNPIELNNAPLYRGSFHYAKLLQVYEPLRASERLFKRDTLLSDRVLNSMTALVPHAERFFDPCLTFVWNSHEMAQCYKVGKIHFTPESIWNTPSMGNRTTDVFFGASTYGSTNCTMPSEGRLSGSYLICRHRTHVLSLLLELKIRRPDLNIVVQIGDPILQHTVQNTSDITTKTLRAEMVRDFYKQLSQSKICVVPVGFGEMTNKDFESAMSGCVILKPGGHNLFQYGNIYGDDTSLTADWDLHDLNSVVEDALANPKLLDKLAGKALKKIQGSSAGFHEDFAKFVHAKLVERA